MAKYFYGLRESDNEIISILDVPFEENGLACGCICPECKRKFEACSLPGKNVEPYFRHSSLQNEQTGTYADCSSERVHETALHEMAKRIIHEEKRILIPAVNISIWDVSIKEIPKFLYKRLPDFSYGNDYFVECEDVTVETFDKNKVKPDVIIDSNKGRIYVEIYVTNKKKTEYYHKVSGLGIPTYEIDLSELKNRRISKEELKKIVIDGIGRKGKWVYHPSMESALEFARKYYTNHPIVKDFFAKQSRQHSDDGKTVSKQEDVQEKKNKITSSSGEIVSTYDENVPKQSLDRILSLSITDRTYLESVDFNQNVTPIYNSFGTRMIKCIQCDKIKPFKAILDPGSANKGICRDCAMKRK